MLKRILSKNFLKIGNTGIPKQKVVLFLARKENSVSKTVFTAGERLKPFSATLLNSTRDQPEDVMGLRGGGLFFFWEVLR